MHSPHLLRISATTSIVLSFGLSFFACGTDRATSLLDAGDIPSGDLGTSDGAGRPEPDGRDAGAMADGAAGEDAGAGSSDAGAPLNDATSSLGPACAELDACCAELPQGMAQMRCTTTVASGDEGACMQGLDVAHLAGACESSDAGPPRDAGPLGPECRAYLDCCPTLPSAVQTICMNTANAGDEGRCTQALGLARQLNQCMALGDAGANDASAGDSGASDASLVDGDLGDAGTSTAADAA